MGCLHTDCFTCPYPDCIISAMEAAARDRGLTPEEAQKRMKETRRRQYLKQKEGVKK